MHKRETDNFTHLAIAVVAIVVAALVWTCAAAMGLDLLTGLKVAAGLALTAVLARASLKHGYRLFSFANVWPVLLGLVWISTWPALDSWAASVDYFTASSVSFAAFTEGSSSGALWWDAWYTQILGLVALVAGGYALREMFQTRD